MQRTLRDQLDNLLEEKEQLVAQLHALAGTADPSTAPEFLAAKAEAEAEAEKQARRAHAEALRREAFSRQQDTFSDEPFLPLKSEEEEQQDNDEGQGTVTGGEGGGGTAAGAKSEGAAAGSDVGQGEVHPPAASLPVSPPLQPQLQPSVASAMALDGEEEPEEGELALPSSATPAAVTDS
jgi:hypothetical protein